MWDASTGEFLNRFIGHSNDVNEVPFSPDGLILATASDDHTVGLWNINTGNMSNRLRGHSDHVHTLMYSHAGSLIASGSNRDGNTVCVWVTATSETLHQIPENKFGIKDVESLAFLSNSNIIAVGSYDKISILDAGKGTLITTM